ncbi:hypothetical protein CRM22_005309 [Opisthorchis felineus]|uniref:Trafficking protein particle complex subunit n=1 Tax=Opisthorchis felineus TaxID=147828 RepID=A0A4S2LRP5_OPIFE|nr:hypothetical protein CRM22_005309 [Opisthorchis felineus]
MTVYNLYIFDQRGVCVYYHEWTKTKQGEKPSENETKLLHGMLIGLKRFIGKISPSETVVTRFSYSTNTYRLHFYESPTMIKIVLNTDNACAPVHEELETVFRIYTKFVSQNPFCASAESVDSQLFTSMLDSYVQSLQIFKK